jgi:hypothetical protein
MISSNTITAVYKDWPGYPQIESNTGIDSEQTPSSAINFKEHKVAEIEITLEQVYSVLSEAEKKMKTAEILGIIGGVLVGAAILIAGIALMVFGIATLNPLLISLGTTLLVISGAIGVACGFRIDNLYKKITICPKNLPADNLEFHKFINESDERKKLVREDGLRLVAKAFSEKQELDFKRRQNEQQLKKIKERHELEINEYNKKGSLLIHKQELRLSAVNVRIAERAKQGNV